MKKLCIFVAIGLWCGCHRGRPFKSWEATPNNGEATAGPPIEPSRESVGRPKDGPAAPAKITDWRPRTARDAATVLVELNAQLKDAFFDYDRAELRPEAIAALRQDAALLLPILQEFPQIRVVVEGHCDERGSAEYNLALGDRRAERAAKLLEDFAVPPARTKMVSYGNEAPQCREAAESCWQRNRRAHVVVTLSPAT